MRTFPSLISAILLVATLAISAHGQVVSKQQLSLDGANKILAAAVAEAQKDPTAGAAIAVVDDAGNLLAFQRLDGTFAAASNISIGKARTAAIFRRSTRAFEDIVAQGRTAMVALQDFTPLQGGEPITVDGQVVGAIGVSGATSAARDTEIAVAGAGAAATLMASASPGGR